MKCRIVERIHPSKRVSFIIQQKHFLFGWRDASGHIDIISFETLNQAKDNLWRHDGTKAVDRVHHY